MADSSHVDPRVERTQAAILQAAEELLMEGGPDAITHATIAERAKVSRTTVYTHHPTREDLLRGVLETRRPRLMVDLNGDLRHDLIAGLSVLAEDLGDEQRRKVFVAILERSHHDPELEAARKAIVGGAMAMFRATLHRGIDEGRLRAGLDTDLAMASLVGTFFFRRFLSDQSMTQEVIEKVVDTFLDSNAPR